MKINELRPCDNCQEKIVPVFYRVHVQVEHMMIDHHVVNQILGTAQIFHGNLALGRMMSPDSDVATAFTTHEREFLLCQQCALMGGFPISVTDILIEDEEDDDAGEE